jgi:hypothetical protein
MPREPVSNIYTAIKGARSAPGPGWARLAGKRRATVALAGRGAAAAGHRRACRGDVACWAPPAALRPCRATAASARQASPAARRTG